MQLAPVAFEWNESFLADLMDAVFSCHFGTFLFDCEREREEARLSDRTESFWSWVNWRHNSDHTPYRNIFYDAQRENRVLLPDVTGVRLWSYYLRFREKKPKDRDKTIIAPLTLEDVFRQLKEAPAAPPPPVL